MIVPIIPRMTPLISRAQFDRIAAAAPRPRIDPVSVAMARDLAERARRMKPELDAAVAAYERQRPAMEAIAAQHRSFFDQAARCGQLTHIRKDVACAAK